MIFRQSIQELRRPPEGPGVRPAFQIFLDTQKITHIPRAIIFQSDHARLAGEIARRLCPYVFGHLPDEVLRAIAEHDAGWRQSDDDQIEQMAERPLRPFPKLSAEETIPSWRACVSRAIERSPLEGVIVSRHFCALATQDPARRPFADEENPRREKIERALDVGPGDLDRWMGALGFCDNVSLYLCSGAQEATEFLLGHSALAESRNARKVFFEWVDGHPRFSSPIMEPGAKVSVHGYEPEDNSSGMRPLTLEWQFLQ